MHCFISKRRVFVTGNATIINGVLGVLYQFFDWYISYWHWKLKKKCMKVVGSLCALHALLICVACTGWCAFFLSSARIGTILCRINRTRSWNGNLYVRQRNNVLGRTDKYVEKKKVPFCNWHVERGIPVPR